MRTLVLTRESVCSSGIARWMCPAGSWNCGFEFVGEVRVGNTDVDILGVWIEGVGKRQEGTCWVSGAAGLLEGPGAGMCTQWLSTDASAWSSHTGRKGA